MFILLHRHISYIHMIVLMYVAMNICVDGRLHPHMDGCVCVCVVRAYPRARPCFCYRVFGCLSLRVCLNHTCANLRHGIFIKGIVASISIGA